jgi:serine/threonine-protein kinase
MKERIGHYRIVSELGRGGMGVVYKAHEESLNRFVAIKVLGSHVAEDPAYVQRFVREAQSAARLSHPNIVQIYSISEDDGEHFFVMEYVSGTSLQSVIKNDGRMDITRAENIVLQAAAGLQAAHEQGIIHRDIKPANLMIDNRGLVKIADFGLALPMGATARLTATGMVMGSPGYLSPEQCKNEEVDHRTDIYSLGVTLFEALTGRIPFEADSPLALIRQIVDVEPPDVCELNPDVDDATRRILSRMMAKDRDARYADCSELITDVREDMERRGDGSREIPPSALPPAPADAPPVGIHSDPTVAVDSEARSIPEPPIPDSPQPKAPAATQMPADGPLPAAPQAPARRRSLALVALVLLAFAAAAMVGGAALLWKSGVLTRLAERREPQQTDTRQATPAPVVAPEVDDESVEETPGDAVRDQASGGERTSRPGDAAPGPSAADTLDASPSTTSPQPGDRPAAAAGDRRTSADRRDPQPQRPVPAPDGAAVVSVGETLLAGEVAAYLQSALDRRGIRVVDASSIPAVSEVLAGEQPVVRGALRSELRSHARHLVIARAEYLGERPLQYMGRSEVAFQARLSVAILDLDDGRVIGKPLRRRVEYTHLNVERVAAEALRRWTRETSAGMESR